MVVVAVAGLGSIGRQIASQILSDRKHTLVVLSRSARPELRGAIVRQVDYASHESLVQALGGVHTVLSCLFSLDYDETVAAQLALLSAAKEVGALRFAPSEYSYQEAGNQTMGLYASKRAVWKATMDSGLEYTAFRPGQWMNFFAHGSPHPRVLEDAFDGLPNFPFVVDLRQMQARIPGTGNEKITFTTTQDVGRFVAASLDFDRWDQESTMAGSVTTYNEVVREAERIIGKKVGVEYESIERLKSMIEASDGMSRFYLEAKLSVAKGEAYVEPVLNEKVAFTPLSVREFLEKWWEKAAGE